MLCVSAGGSSSFCEEAQCAKVVPSDIRAVLRVFFIHEREEEKEEEEEQDDEKRIPEDAQHTPQGMREQQ